MRQQIVVDDRALGRVRPLETVDPPPVRPRPVAPRDSAGPRRSSNLPKPMPTPLQIFPGVIARPRQIPDRFVRRRRRPHRRQQPARPSSTSLRASRRFVFTRSPGFRGINAGAIDLAASPARSSSAAATRSRTGPAS